MILNVCPTILERKKNCGRGVCDTPKSLSYWLYPHNVVGQILKIFERLRLKNNSGRKNFDKFTKIVLKHLQKLVKNALFTTNNFGKRNINLRLIKCSSVRNDFRNTLLVRQYKLPTPAIIPKFCPCWRAPHVNIPGLHIPL